MLFLQICGRFICDFVMKTNFQQRIVRFCRKVDPGLYMEPKEHVKVCWVWTTLHVSRAVWADLWFLNLSIQSGRSSRMLSLVSCCFSECCLVLKRHILVLLSKFITGLSLWFVKSMKLYWLFALCRSEMMSNTQTHTSKSTSYDSYVFATLINSTWLPQNPTLQASSNEPESKKVMQ